MIYVFGDCELDDRLYELRRAGVPLEIERKVFDVLTYLIHHRDRLVPKDELLDKLWPGVVVGEAALTRCITAARKAVGDDGGRQEIIKTQHGRGYRFVATVIERTDEPVFQFERPEEPPGPLLPLSSHPPETGEGRGESPPPSGDSALPVRPARRWYGQRGGLALVGLLLLVGVIATVQYLSLRPPAPSANIPPEQLQPLPLPDKLSLVVLPFTNMSDDPEQEYFSDGMTEDLTTALSKLSSLFVISRNSAFTYKGKAVKAQDVGKELGVQYVLEGSVQRAGSQVRITAQLIDATTGYQLWSEHYDRPLQNVFALQDEIVQRIVTTLKLRLTLWEQGILVHKTTDNLEAYDFYLRGLELYSRDTKETHAQARQMFERAIELDPQYAAPYAFLGWISYEEVVFHGIQDPQALERAFALAHKAVALDDSLAEARHLVAYSYLFHKQHEQAIAEAERTIALNLNRVECYASMAQILIYAGRPAEAFGWMEKAMRLNPHYPAFYLHILAQAYGWMERYEEALATWKSYLLRSPGGPLALGAHLSLAAIYSVLDRGEEARAEVAEVLRINPQFSLEGLRQIALLKDQASLERVIAALRKAGLQ
jgi:TolB-like protein/DNA-binding winged helix-turn-helix (wHTH) protein